MKRLTVNQRLNPEYLGPGITDDKPKQVYVVTKLVNALMPEIGEALTAKRLEWYCDSDDWTVTVT